MTAPRPTAMRSRVRRRAVVVTVLRDSERVRQFLAPVPGGLALERIAAATGLTPERARVVLDALVSRGLLRTRGFDFYAPWRRAVDEREELIADAKETLAAFAAVYDDAVRVVVRHVEERTGETLAVQRPGVLDARLQDLFSMESQARSYMEAMTVIRRWMLPEDQRRVGDMLKIIPAEEAELITGHLRGAGVLPA